MGAKPIVPDYLRQKLTEDIWALTEPRDELDQRKEQLEDILSEHYFWPDINFAYEQFILSKEGQQNSTRHNEYPPEPPSLPDERQLSTDHHTDH